jgi:parallel beta-helix repeat protein
MIFGFIVIIIEVPLPVSGATIYVDDDYISEDATHKKTIQAAVNAAQPSDTVFVYNGTYYERVTLSKTINLTGEDKNSTIINGGASGDVVRLYDDWVNITGFTITNAGPNTGEHGIDMNDAHNCKIINNNISGNLGHGIVLQRATNNYISSNIISNNSRFGLYIFTGAYKSSFNSISYNIIMGNEIGIYSYKSADNNIAYNNISRNQDGIHNSGSSNNITNNNVSLNNGYGIYISNSAYSNLTDNKLINDGIFIVGNQYYHWNTHNISSNNTVNGKPVYYRKNKIGGLIPQDAGQVILANCSDMLLQNLNIQNTDIGVETGYSYNITIIDNEIVSNNNGGMYLWFTPNCQIENNNISSNEGLGIYIIGSPDTIFTNNTINLNNEGGIFLNSDDDILINNEISMNNDFGIRIDGSANYNEIINNNITLNDIGISCYSIYRNTFIYNDILSNVLYGISFNWTWEAQVYHNNIIGNGIQAFDNRDDNLWNASYPLGGNYWSDYSGVDNFKGPNQDQPGSDGIGDINYSIDSDSVDNYPLMEPYSYEPLVNYTILKQGWNLISIPNIQDNQEITKVLEMIDGYYDAVQWYDSIDKNDHWKHYKIGKPFGNDLYELNESIGFWIHIKQPGDAIFVYNGTQPTVNQTISLILGWNLVGYPSTNAKNRTDGLNNIDFGSEVDAIWTYNATTQTWKEITASDNFEVGRGYWIHSKVTKTWIVPL